MSMFTGRSPRLRAISARSRVAPVDSVAMAPTVLGHRPTADGCCGSATRSCRTTPTSDCLDFSWAETRRPPPRPPPAQGRMCREPARSSAVAREAIIAIVVSLRTLGQMTFVIRASRDTPSAEPHAP